ncbi:MAG TPA: hypothetical protein VIG72_04015 [Pontibacter sp.]
MRHIKLFTTDYLTLEYNVVDDYLSADWHGAVPNEAIVQGYEQILFYIQKERSHKLLDNHYNVEGLWAYLSDWFALDWHPRAEAAGLEYHAAVYSKNYFSRLSTNQAINMVKSGIVKGFDTARDAENWLRLM